MKKDISKFIFILIIALFLEVIVFNITSYRVLLGRYNKKVYEDLEFMYYGDDESRAYLEINNINTKVGTLKLEIKDKENNDSEEEQEVIEYKVFYSDETSVKFRGLNSKMYINSSEKSKYIPLYLSGETRSLVISINRDVYDEGRINKVILNEKIPFEFNIIRFLVVLGILLFSYFMKNGKIFNELYSTKNIKQEIILIGILGIFLILLSLINTYSCEEKSSDKDEFLRLSTDEGLYNKDFVDSIIDKKLYLLEDPSEEFLNLNNPYDTLERDSVNRDEDYKWDTAFYNGHQYVYFGILPLLLTFLPYNILTHKYLKVSFVVFGFSILIFILLKEILLKILNKYFKEIQFKNVIYYLITFCSGTLILYANGIPRFYEVVIIAGLYFVLQGIFFIIISKENEKNRYKNLFLGCLCLALSVACRPTDLFASLLILPYLISLLVENIKNLKNINRSKILEDEKQENIISENEKLENKVQKIENDDRISENEKLNKKQNKSVEKQSIINLLKLIVAIVIPYATVGILLMYYNYIRFGNVFDFGSKYQLTINNMLSLGNRIYTIPMGLVCNLFMVPKFIPDFPFILNSNDLMTFYGYYYIENMIGGLFMIAPICFMNFFTIKINKKLENKELKMKINSLLVVGLIIAILSITMAGSNQRYLIDYAWMIILAGILIFESLYSLLKSNEAKRILQFILCVTTIYTFILAISTGIVSEKDYFRNNSPEEYYKTKYTICFWE